MFWVGTQEAIEAAEDQAAAIVTALPAYRDGVRVPNPTTRWAEPQETATAGVWAIPAYPDMETPGGCQEVESVDFPEPEGDV